MNKTNKSHNTNGTTTDLVCFSHLRWNFVFQRPQHLLSRFAKDFRVFFIEEPVFDAQSDSLLIRNRNPVKILYDTPAPIGAAMTFHRPVAFKHRRLIIPCQLFAFCDGSNCYQFKIFIDPAIGIAAMVRI